MAKILVVEDDAFMYELVRIQLEHEGHVVDIALTGLDGVHQLRLHSYDLAILDWMLPDISGIEVMRQYRDQGGLSPILMLTSKGTINDKAQGFDAGADDYLVKPFHPTELSMRTQALLRRPRALSGKILRVSNLELNTQTRIVTKEGEIVDLLPKEINILELLMRHPNQSFTGEALLDRIWKSDSSASVDTVRTHIKTLRQKLKENTATSLIQTTRGFGYRIVDQSKASSATT